MAHTRLRNRSGEPRRCDIVVVHNHQDVTSSWCGGRARDAGVTEVRFRPRTSSAWQSATCRWARAGRVRSLVVGGGVRVYSAVSRAQDDLGTIVGASAKLLRADPLPASVPARCSQREVSPVTWFLTAADLARGRRARRLGASACLGRLAPAWAGPSGWEGPEVPNVHAAWSRYYGLGQFVWVSSSRSRYCSSDLFHPRRPHVCP